MSWEKVPIKDVCEGIYDGPHATPPLSESGAIFLGIQNFKNGRLDFSDVRYISEEDLLIWTKRVIPQAGDIVFSYEATLNLYAIIPAGFRGCLGRRMALIRVDKNKINYRYLYYYLHSPTWKAVIAENTVTGATVDRIPLIRFPDFEIELPPLDVQNNIADILSAYDDLIENNQRQIKLLEEAAMRLYREWFVFMRFPGHESVRIVDGVPEGWEKKCLRHLISYEIGGGWGNDNESSGFDIRTWVIRGTDIDGLSSGQIHSIPLRFNKQQTLSSRMLSHGDIIFEVSGGSKNVGVAKSYLITQPLIDYLGHPVICASFCKMIRPISLDYAEYLYSTLRHLRDSGITEEYELKSASSIINFKWADFLDLHFVLIPPETIMHAFNDCISPIYTKIVSMSIQVETLQKARDALLPRLMNGGEGLKLEGGAV